MTKSTVTSSRAIGLLCGGLLSSALLAACGSSDPQPPVGSGLARCVNDVDCAAPGTRCSSQYCVARCTADSECASGFVCGASCNAQGAVCATWCGLAPDASKVGSCQVTPGAGVVRDGSTLQLQALVLDAAGKPLPYRAVSWRVDAGPGTVDAVSGLVTGGTPSGSVGAITVTAVAGNKACSATIQSYAKPTAGLRVVAIDGMTKLPLAGAFVLLDNVPKAPGKQAVTDANGVATFPASALTNPAATDVHVMKSGYHYASYIGVQVSATGTDVLAALNPYTEVWRRSWFSGSMTPDDFVRLPAATGDLKVQLAFFGSGVANSLADFSTDSLLGSLHDVTIKISTLFGPKTFSLPTGLLLGTNSPFAVGLFGAKDSSSAAPYRIYAEPGQRHLWGLGGNVGIPLSLLLTLQSGSSTDLGSLLPRVLPLLSNLQAGGLAGATLPPSGSATGTPVQVPLNTPLSLKVAARLPLLPQVNGAYVDGAIVVAGVGAYPAGFVPLGITAALAASSTAGRTGKLLDPTCTATASNDCATSLLPLSMAPRLAGLDGSPSTTPYSTAAIALNFGGLTAGVSTGLAASAIVVTQDRLPGALGGGAPAPIDFTGTSFLALPGAGKVFFDGASRQGFLSAPDADAGVQIYRFEVENAAKFTWSVWAAPVGTNGPSQRFVKLFDPGQVDGSLTDPLTPAQSGNGSPAESSIVRLLSLATNDPTQTYGQIIGFGSVRLDSLGNKLRRFTAASVATSGVPRP